jgi:flagellar biosynthesis protein FlhB
MTATLSAALRSFAFTSYASCSYLSYLRFGFFAAASCFLYSLFHFVEEMEVKQSLVSALCQSLFLLSVLTAVVTTCVLLMLSAVKSTTADSCVRLCFNLHCTSTVLSAINAVTYAAMTFSRIWQMEVKQPLVRRLIMSLELTLPSDVYVLSTGTQLIQFVDCSVTITPCL